MMGLAVGVGDLADLLAHDEDGAAWVRKSLKKVNALLAKNKLPAHDEPDTLPPLRSRAAIQGYPYSFLHHLRRFAAHAKAKPKWKPKPFPESADPADDPVIADEQAMLDSHLLCHSDCEGFYVPVDFPDPLFSTSKIKVPGAMLGSSQGLMRELIAVAPYLGITLKNGVLSDAEAKRINKAVKQEVPFWIEQCVWLSLFEAARLSIEHRTAICFN
jgi:hypothetical protein